MIQNFKYTDEEIKLLVRDKIEKVTLSKGVKSITKHFKHPLLGIVLLVYTDKVTITLNFLEKNERNINF